VDRVLTVCEAEQQHIQKRGQSHVSLVSHGVVIEPTESPFEQRRDFFFAGAIFPNFPNEDSIVWFVHEILPKVRALSGQDLALIAAGRCASPHVQDCNGKGLQLLGSVPDLRPHFARARVFVAPLRLGAGIPLKVLHAAAHGVPVVATGSGSAGLGGRQGTARRQGCGRIRPKVP
jgi:glycosyltransferase involved in cell wall biosynthesis